MYGTRRTGGQLPYALGERVPGLTTNLGDVSPAGYGPYLGNVFDDIQKIAGQVGIASGELSKVTKGEATVATIPTGYASLTLPIPGSPISQAIPLWVIGVGAAGLLYMAFSKRR